MGTQHCGVYVNHAAHQFEGNANAFRRATMFCPGTHHAASGWTPTPDWPLIESHPTPRCDGLCEHAQRAENWVAECHRQAALFQAETLRFSEQYQRAATAEKALAACTSVLREVCRVQSYADVAGLRDKARKALTAAADLPVPEETQ